MPLNDDERKQRKQAADKAYTAAHRGEANARARAWYQANKERHAAGRKKRYDPIAAAEYNKQYRAENAERIRAQDKARSKTEKRKLTQKKWYEKNARKILARVTIWVKNNPDKARLNLKNAIGRRRARIKSLPIEAINPTEVYHANGGICGLCGTPVSLTEFEIDHIRPIAKGGGHIRSNVHIAHRTCNKKKGASLNAVIYSI